MEILSAFGALGGLLILLALFVLGVLLPLFVFLIYQEAVKTNKFLKLLVDLTIDPEVAKRQQAELKILQEKLRRRR